MRETAETLEAWALETFGEAPSFSRIAARANVEMAELLRAAAVLDECAAEPEGPAMDTLRRAVGEECADVALILARVAAKAGVDLFAEMDRKMAVNRRRVWKQDGAGTGFHVRDRGEGST